jgi:anaerobic ribonucleoside-triphosphate reductase activating protein
MRIAGLVQDSIVDGPGLRFTVFAQGCPHHCPGCHNPATHDPDGGSEMATAEVIRQMLSNPLTDGTTLTGGEPFAQAAACAEIAEAARKAGLNVWAYSGWTFDELMQSGKSDVKKLLSLTDVLVDGRFILSERSLNLKWRGSKNQRLIDVRRSLAEGKAIMVE